MPKPMSMADKIRAKKAKKVDPEEREKEKAAVAHALGEPKATPPPAPEKPEVIELRPQEPKEKDTPPAEPENTPDKTPDKTVDTPRTNGGHAPDSTADISAEYPRTNGGQSTVLSADISTTQSAALSPNTTADKTPDKTTDITMDKALDTIKGIIHLSRREAQIYKVLEKHGSGFTTSRHLAGLTGISVGYIQKLFRFLRKKGAITYKTVNGTRKGYTFELVQGAEVSFPNEMKPIEDMGFITGYNPNQNPGQNGGYIPGQNTGSIRGHGRGLISSSSILSNNNKTTTTRAHARGGDAADSAPDMNEIQRLITEHPDLDFWQDRLLPKQFVSWMDLCECPPEVMVQYLAHAAFQYEKSGGKDASGRNIENTPNWFFGTIKKLGGFPKPDGFKNFEERRIEQKEKLLREMAELRRRKALAERGDEFEKMLADENSQEFEDCLAGLSEIEKSVSSPRAFETAMRREFDKQKGRDKQGDQAKSMPVDDIEF